MGSVEKLQVANSMKEKILSDYARKVKQIETQAAIARSTAVNKARLEKIRARQDVMSKLKADTQTALLAELKNEAKSKEFLTKLITQGMLMLLEDEVEVRCRASDDALVSSCLATAMDEYTKAIANQTGATKKCKLTLDKTQKLPPPPGGGAGMSWNSCLGGVVLACQNGSITIDNTIDSRLGLVLEQAKPTIRKLLFNA